MALDGANKVIPNGKMYVPGQLKVGNAQNTQTQGTQAVKGEDKKKKTGEEKGSGYSDASLMMSQPINYTSYNDQVMQNVQSFLEERWKIIDDLVKSLNPDKDEKKAEERMEEKKFWEKKDMNKVLDQARYAEKLTKQAIEDIQSLLMLLNTPTSDPKVRASMVMSELGKISSRLMAAMDSVKGSLSTLNNIDPSDEAGKKQKADLTKVLTAMGKTVEEVDKACGQVKKQVERS
ncbi:MAG TPA: hypothetical protein VMD02_01775 [Candidatus Omnitrophota bacterium]|nr:hypothetical protein [Candidatus Omnitrophota bacterium]